MKKLKLWIQTNLSYAATKEKLLHDRQFLAYGDDFEGKLSFRFKNLKDVTFQITTGGKVGIFYPESLDVKVALEQLKPYLVKADGSPASINHLIEEKNQVEDRPFIITVEEPIPISLALQLMQKYPNIEIKTKKKSIWRRIRDFLTEPSIPTF